MTRGTTPTFILTFPETADFGDAKDIIVTFADQTGRVLLEKDAPYVHDNVVEVTLTQEETLALPVAKLQLQVNWTYENGSESKRACSNIEQVSVCKNLHNEVM